MAQAGRAQDNDSIELLSLFVADRRSAPRSQPPASRFQAPNDRLQAGSKVQENSVGELQPPGEGPHFGQPAEPAQGRQFAPDGGEGRRPAYSVTVRSAHMEPTQQRVAIHGPYIVSRHIEKGQSPVTVQPPHHPDFP